MGLHEKSVRKTEKTAGAEVGEELCVYREKQLAGPKTCKLPSKKSMFYCTRDPARISRTIIYRNNIDTDPPYWVLLVLRRVEGRFC